MARVESIDRIKEMFRAGQHREACEACVLLCEAQPKNLEALKLAGKIFGILGVYKDAQLYLGSALQLEPNNPEIIFNLGICSRELQDLSQADLFFGWYTRLNPTDANGWYCLSQSQYDRKQYLDAQSSIKTALELNDQEPEAWIMLGLIAGKQTQYANAQQSFKKATELKNEHAEAWFYLGLAHAQLKQPKEALEAFDRALSLRRNYAEAFLHRAAALEKLNRFEDALKSYDDAIAANPRYADAWSDKAALLDDLKRFEEAIEHYDQALSIEPKLAEAWSNKGITLTQLYQYQKAIAHFDRAITLKPNFFEAITQKGATLIRLNNYEDALTQFDRAIGLKPDYAEAWALKGESLQKLKRHEDSLICLHKAFQLEPDKKFIFGEFVGLKMKVCDWTEFDESLESLRRKISNNEPVINPFTLLSLCDEPNLHLKAARIFCAEHFKNPSKNHLPPRRRSKKTRVGYFSGDFRNHPLSQLIVEALEQHDKESFETFGFSLGPKPENLLRKRILSSFDDYYDCESLSDKEIIDIARSLELDIAVDLHGHTTYSRTAVFVSRAAPIQVNFLGYPGTIGVNSIDYILADSVVLPTTQFSYFSENVVHLPNCYMANDSKRKISDKTYTKLDCSLPHDAFVFCCFNNSYKILPQMYQTWMRILSNTRNSVLWLMGTSPIAEKNLKIEAEKNGISSNRIVFADFLPGDEHLSRMKVADLFLDTFPYNAHTTASDALWAGLPLITLQGQSFASRVASSLLAAVGLPELVTTSLQDYEKLAIDLANSPTKLRQLRSRLEVNRLTTPLFNGAVFCRDLERAYIEMIRRHEAGEPPGFIDTKSLSR